jgi:hypothetical protein
MRKKSETEDEAALLSYGGHCPDLTGIRWLRGQAPSFSETLTLIHLWSPSEKATAHFQKLNEIRARFPGKVAVVTLSDLFTDEDEDIEELKFFTRDVHFAVGLAPDDTWKEFEGDDSSSLSFLFDARKKLLWRGPEQAMAAVIEALVIGKMSAATMKQLADLRERFDSTDSDDELDYDERAELLHKLACQILDRNPADTDILRHILESTQIRGDTREFRDLLTRIDLAHWSPEDASALALSLIDHSSSLHLRPADVVLRLVEHAEKCSWLSSDSLCECAEVRAFLGDFKGAIQLLERAVKREDDPDDSLYPVRDVLAAMRERTRVHAGIVTAGRRPPRSEG